VSGEETQENGFFDKLRRKLPPPKLRELKQKVTGRLQTLRRQVTKKLDKAKETVHRKIDKLERKIERKLGGRRHKHHRKITDAPVGASISDLTDYTHKRVHRVHPRGIGAQLPGDRENNEDAIDRTKFDLRWAKSIKEKDIVGGNELIPKTDRTNEKFREFASHSIKQPLIEPHLFNS